MMNQKMLRSEHQWRDYPQKGKGHTIYCNKEGDSVMGGLRCRYICKFEGKTLHLIVFDISGK